MLLPYHSHVSPIYLRSDSATIAEVGFSIVADYRTISTMVVDGKFGNQILQNKKKSLTLPNGCVRDFHISYSPKRGDDYMFIPPSIWIT